MLAAIERTSAQSLQHRFFFMKRHFSESERAFFMNVDFKNHVAFVALADDAVELPAARVGLTVEPHLQMSTDDVARLRPPSLHQGRVIGAGAVSNTGQPLQAAGGKTAGASRRVPEEA